MSATNMEPEGDKASFNVLCVDGGGMRGLYSACLLDTLIRRMSTHLNGQAGDLGRSFDLICGTSTGAILAAALAVGIPLDRVQDLYSVQGPLIFKRPYPKKWARLPKIGWLLAIPWFVRHLCKPSSSVEVLNRALENLFGESTLGDLYGERRIALCIPVVNASNLRSKVFKTPHQPHFNRDQSIRLLDACMASCAAPIILPLYKFPVRQNRDRDDVYMDGGLWANSPVLVGLIEALALARDAPIRILSVGTCDEPSGDPSLLEKQDWGLLRWKAGLGVTDASLSAQAAGHMDMARLLVAQLKARGVDVGVCRLREGQKSSEQYSAIGLDRADPTALRTLRTLAENDANEIVAALHRGGDQDQQFAAEILSTVKPFTRE